MNHKATTACFTGHRILRDPPDVIASRAAAIVETLIQQGYTYFCAGGARGFDALASGVVLRLKERYPHICLILILPFQSQYEQEKEWSKTDIEEYNRLKANASEIIYVQEKYSRGCYYKRNRCLVERSSICVSYQYKNSGGTAYTTKYAAQQNVKVFNCRYQSDKTAL